MVGRRGEGAGPPVAHLTLGEEEPRVQSSGTVGLTSSRVERAALGRGENRVSPGVTLSLAERATAARSSSPARPVVIRRARPALTLRASRARAALRPRRPEPSGTGARAKEAAAPAPSRGVADPVAVVPLVESVAPSVGRAAASRTPAAQPRPALRHLPANPEGRSHPQPLHRAAPPPGAHRGAATGIARGADEEAPNAVTAAARSFLSGASMIARTETPDAVATNRGRALKSPTAGVQRRAGEPRTARTEGAQRHSGEARPSVRTSFGLTWS